MSLVRVMRAVALATALWAGVPACSVDGGGVSDPVSTMETGLDGPGRPLPGTTIPDASGGSGGGGATGQGGAIGGEGGQGGSATKVDAGVSHNDAAVGLDALADRSTTDRLAAVTEGNVVCGTMTCPLATSYCCANRDGTSCRLRGTSCSEGSARRCDGPEDCGSGSVCCARVDPTSVGVLRAECRQASNCDPGASLCHTKADCAAGQSCCPQLVNGTSFSVCRTRCN